MSIGFDFIRFDRTPQPDHGELASQIISLLSISVMATLFGIKTYNVQFKYLSYSRWLILALYVMSWGFTTSATLFASTNNGKKKKKKNAPFFSKWCYLILLTFKLRRKLRVLSIVRNQL
jgi:hypothetical protein